MEEDPEPVGTRAEEEMIPRDPVKAQHSSGGVISTF